jgi:hypothetical protein
MITISGDSAAANNAAIWLRAHYNIPENQVLFDEFEREFKCRIICDVRDDPWYQPDSIEFNDEKCYTIFVLRWS